LKNKGEVTIELKGNKEYICLTEKGKKSIQKKMEELLKLKNYFKSIPPLQEKFNEERSKVPTITKGPQSLINPDAEKDVKNLLKNISEWEDNSSKSALVIGISEYSLLQPLSFCKNDGEEMYKLLSSLEYKITDTNNLTGFVKWDQMRDAIYDFFSDQHIKSEDTLVFYYSGHGVPDIDGDMYLATSEINPDQPKKRGFPFNDLTQLMQNSNSTRIVAILDCCYSGSAKISKGHEDDAAKLATAAINRQSSELNTGEGRCILAASQALQEAYVLEEGNHSVFTYYLLQGLRGEEEAAADNNGNITVDSLGKYIYNKIMSLPIDKKPKQKPIRKVEASGDIVLAHYSNFAKIQRADEDTLIKAEIPHKNPAANIQEKESQRIRSDSDHNVTLLSDIDEAVKRIFEEEGFIDVPDCAERLGITRTKVREIISRLGLVSKKNKDFTSIVAVLPELQLAAASC
jgi:hypothetical protein